MSVTFKKVLRKDPFHKDGTGKYYPQLIVWGKSATLESIAVQMKESSSLTLGDIQSVITNFVGAMRRELFNGRSVNIDNFGVFSLSATTEGSEKKDGLSIYQDQIRPYQLPCFQQYSSAGGCHACRRPYGLRRSGVAVEGCRQWFGRWRRWRQRRR